MRNKSAAMPSSGWFLAKNISLPVAKNAEQEYIMCLQDFCNNNQFFMEI
jgi:hypothetical protein